MSPHGFLSEKMYQKQMMSQKQQQQKQQQNQERVKPECTDIC